jgi:hypothetical protein
LPEFQTFACFVQKHLMNVKIQEIDNATVRVTLIVERHSKILAGSQFYNQQ